MTKTLIASLLSLVSVAALAQSAPQQDAPLTRAQVLAQVEQARADGTLGVADPSFLPVPVYGAGLSRAQVKADVAQALARHEVLAVEQNEATPFVQPAAVAAPRTRLAGNDRRAQVNQWAVDYRNSVYAGS